MKKFLVLYKADIAAFEAMMKTTTPERRKAFMDAWMHWMDVHKAAIVDGGAPLGKTKRIDDKGIKDSKNDIGGYSIVQAADAATATKLFAKDHPHLQMPGSWIEVVEMMPM